MQKSSSVKSRLQKLNNTAHRDPSQEMLRRQRELYKLFQPGNTEPTDLAKPTLDKPSTNPPRSLLFEHNDLAGTFGLKSTPPTKAVYSQKYQLFLQDCKNIIHDVRRKKLDLSLRTLNRSNSSENLKIQENSLKIGITKSASRGHLLDSSTKHALERIGIEDGSTKSVAQSSKKWPELVETRKPVDYGASNIFREQAIQDLTKLMSTIRNNREVKSRHNKEVLGSLRSRQAENTPSGNHVEKIRPVRTNLHGSLGNFETKKFEFLKSQTKLCQENYFSPRDTQPFNPSAFLSKAFPSRA